MEKCAQMLTLSRALRGFKRIKNSLILSKFKLFFPQIGVKVSEELILKKFPQGPYVGGNRHGAGELVKADGEVRVLLQVYWSGKSGHPGEDRELQGGQAGQLHHYQGEDCIKT